MAEPEFLNAASIRTAFNRANRPKEKHHGNCLLSKSQEELLVAILHNLEELGVFITRSLVRLIVFKTQLA